MKVPISQRVKAKSGIASRVKPSIASRIKPKVSQETFAAAIEENRYETQSKEQNYESMQVDAKRPQNIVITIQNDFAPPFAKSTGPLIKPTAKDLDFWDSQEKAPVFQDLSIPSSSYQQKSTTLSSRFSKLHGPNRAGYSAIVGSTNVISRGRGLNN